MTTLFNRSCFAGIVLILLALCLPARVEAQEQAAPGPEAATNESGTEKPKPPVPDEAAQAASLATIKDVYKEDYERAKSPAQKLELAKKMLQEGIQTEGDPAGKYVLLRIARDVAAQTGDVEITLTAIDALGKDYQINALEMKAESLAKIAKASASPDAQKELVGKLRELIDTAVAEENIAVAQRFAGLAVTAARNARDPALLKRVVGWTKEIEQVATAYASVKVAFDKLDQSPLDAEANLAVGKFRCFLRDDWGNGLPMLTLGSDAVLKAQAEKDLKGAKEPAEQVSLGDGWWSISEKETGNSKEHIQRRAALWYQQALPRLAGLPKAKVEKRLAELAAASEANDVEQANGKNIDALKGVDPARHARSGKWLKSKENEITSVGPSVIVLPAGVKGDYKFEMEFTRINRDAVSVVFPVAKARTQIWLDFEGFGGLTTTENIDPRYNNTRTPIRLENGKRFTFVVHVASKKPDEATIAATLNGSPCFSWKGPTKDLAVSPVQKWPEDAEFGICTHGDVAVHSFTIRRSSVGPAAKTRRSASTKTKQPAAESADAHHDNALQGDWKATRMWANGKENTNPKFWQEPKTLSVKGTNFTLILADGTFQGSIETDSSTIPLQITFKTVGKEGLELRGVYHQMGNELIVCWVVYSTELGRTPDRPATLDPAEGVFKWLFQRQGPPLKRR